MNTQISILEYEKKQKKNLFLLIVTNPNTYPSTLAYRIGHEWLGLCFKLDWAYTN